MNSLQDPSPDAMAALFGALAKAQGEFPTVGKSKAGQAAGARYKYAALPEVIDTIRPVLAANHLGFVQRQDGDEGGTWVAASTVIVHAEGGMLDCGWTKVACEPRWDKRQNQAVYGAQISGSALTYARRYSLLAAFGLAPDDDDGAGATNARQQRQGPDTTPVREAVPPKDFFAALTTLGTHFRDKDDARLWAFFAHEADKYGGQADVAQAAGWPVAKWSGNNDGLGFVARELATRRRDQGRAK